MILKEQNVSGGDYINANYVNVGHPEIGQGYLGNTGESFLFVDYKILLDFWDVILWVIGPLHYYKV